MKKNFLFTVLSVFTLIVCVSVLYLNAEISKVISLQGFLTDNNNVILHGKYNIEFTLWDQDSDEGSTFLWKEIHNNVVINSGVYSVLLGSESDDPINETLDFKTPYYLGIKVQKSGTDSWSEYLRKEDGKFQTITSATTAFRANIANNVDDGVIDQDKLSNDLINTINNKADKTSLDLKANITEVYTQSYIDNVLSQKADKSDLAAKADKLDVYFKTEIDTKLAARQTKQALIQKPTQMKSIHEHILIMNYPKKQIIQI